MKNDDEELQYLLTELKICQQILEDRGDDLMAQAVHRASRTLRALYHWRIGEAIDSIDRRNDGDH